MQPSTPQETDQSTPVLMDSDGRCADIVCKQRILEGLSPLGLIKEETAIDMASVYVQKISKNFSRLNEVVVAFEDILVREWTQKNTAQRKAFLKTVYPAIPAKHRPDCVNLRDDNKKPSQAAFDVPQMNLENLCRERTLLVWIKSRSEHDPSKFAYFDMENAKLKSDGHHFYGCNLPSRMLLFGRKFPEGYGAIKLANELEDDEVPLTVNIPIGLYTLQLQHRNMNFLLRCCYELLSINNDTEIPSRTYPTPETQKVDSGTWPSTATMALEAAFTAPGTVKLAELEVLVEGKVAEYEDRIISLMADPEYLLDALQKTNEHIACSEERLADKARWILGQFKEGGQPPEIFKKRAAPVLQNMIDDKTKKGKRALVQRMLWGKVGMMLFTEVFTGLLFWKQTQKQMRTVQRSFQEFEDDGTSLRLPEAIEREFRSLELHIESTVEVPINTLLWGLPASSGLRHLYDQTKVEDNTHFSNATFSFPLLNSKTQMKVEERRIHTSFEEFANSEWSMYTPEAVMDEIRLMLETDQKAAALVSPWIAARFSSIALSQRMLLELDSMLPWSKAWKYHIRDIGSERHQRQNDVLTIFNAIYAYCIENPVFPVSSAMRYPVDKKDSKTNREQMIKVEIFLDTFVDGMLSALSDAMGDHQFIGVFEEVVGRWAPPKRTEPWKTGKKQTAAQEGASSLNVSDLTLSSEEQSITSQAQEEKPVPARSFIQAAREKVKTRPQQRAGDNQIRPEVLAEAEPQSETTKIRLDQRAWRCFDIIFNMSNVRQPGELPFQEFCHAMDYIGLQPYEQDGVSFTFRPKPDTHWTRPFACHVPHNPGQGKKWVSQQVRQLRQHLARAVDLGSHSFEKGF